MQPSRLTAYVSDTTMALVEYDCALLRPIAGETLPPETEICEEEAAAIDFLRTEPEAKQMDDHGGHR